jgi:putative membrane protein
MPMTKRMYNTACTAAFAGLMVFAAGAAAQNTGMKSTASRADQRFAMDAAQGGMAEVQFGNLAKDKASSDAVKTFGQKMIDDHSKANDQLKSIASQQGISLPTGIGAKNQAELDRLSKLSGKEFDQAYMKLMLSDHRKDIAEFHKEANNGKDSSLKQFASNTLPTLEEHLQLAESTANKVGTNSADRSK